VDCSRPSHAAPPLLAVDLDDPLADLLDELDLEESKSAPKKFPAKKVEPSPRGSPALRTKEPGVISFNWHNVCVIIFSVLMSLYYCAIDQWLYECVFLTYVVL